MLLPASAISFPVPVGVAATETVHPLNNIFEVGLLDQLADCRMVARFGVPAIRSVYTTTNRHVEGCADREGAAEALGRMTAAKPCTVWSCR